MLQRRRVQPSITGSQATYPYDMPREGETGEIQPDTHLYASVEVDGIRRAMIKTNKVGLSFGLGELKRQTDEDV